MLHPRTPIKLRLLSLDLFHTQPYKSLSSPTPSRGNRSARLDLPLFQIPSVADMTLVFQECRSGTSASSEGKPVMHPCRCVRA